MILSDVPAMGLRRVAPSAASSACQLADEEALLQLATYDFSGDFRMEGAA